MKILLPQNSSMGMDLNGDGKVTADELIQSTMTIFWQLVVVLGAFVGGIGLLIVGPWFLRIIGVIVSVSAIAAFSLGIYRMLRYERMEREERLELERKRIREDWEFDRARGVSEDARATTLDQAQIDVAAMQILQRYYQDKEWSRDAMVGAGLMTAQLWNEANALLKKRRIRHQRKTMLNPPTFSAAWAMYCEAKLRANQHRVVNGDWTEAK
jgi:hypothetical protein